MSTAIDLDRLHQLLWDRTGRMNTLKVHQTELSSELAISKFTMSRLFKQLQEDGRVRKIGSAKLNISTYKVEDPGTWHAKRPAP